MVGTTRLTVTSGAIQRWAASWLCSLVLHLSVFLALVLLVAPARRPAGETLRIELDGGFNEPAGVELVAEGSDSDVAGEPEPLDARPLAGSSIVPSRPLPELGAASPLPSSRGAQARASKGAGGKGVVDFRFGYGHTKLFGVPGEGYRFVYVFDRSGSMGGSGRSALDVAKAELLASLEPLESTHQFQIIFYNEVPKVFAIAGRQGRLVFATEPNKRAAAEFVENVAATGTTRHEEALAAALAMFPDVIYFLTDADEPAMTPSELRRIERLNGGNTVIHAIEFGLGPGGQRENFLTRLARENGGQHIYVDFSTWRSQGPAKAEDAPLKTER